MDFKPLSEREEAIAKKIVDAAYKVHKNCIPDCSKKFMKYVFAMNCSNKG